jgi:ABC-2 type transport system permease protein
MNPRMLAALIAKDFKLYFANRFFALVTFLALVAYAVLFYLLPAGVDEDLELGLYMPQIPPALEQALDEEEVRFLQAESEQALRQAVLDGQVPAGFAFPDDMALRMAGGETVTVHLYLSPEVPPEFAEIYEVILREFAYALTGQELQIEATEVMLGPDMAGAQIPPRQRLLPLLTVFVLMVECLGLASLIAAEVETDTIRALLVTPLTMTGLFAGKGIFGTLFAFAQAGALMWVTGGLGQQPALILTALLIGSALVTGVAFLIASVGRDLMSVMGWGILGMLLLALPAFSLLAPGLASGWIWVLPSYYLVDAVYRVVNFGAGWNEVAAHLLALLGFAAGFLALGVVVLKRKFQ